jgi:hypothetical protein
MSSFHPEQVDALFTAVLIHDDIYADSAFPSSISLGYAPEQLGEIHAICLQLWRTGVDRDALNRIVAGLCRDPVLSPADQTNFKHIRARFKHLQFAHVTCDARHHYPRAFNWLTALMGELQDALNNKKTGAARFYAWAVRCFLSPLPTWLINREITAFRASSTDGLCGFVGAQMDEVRTVLARAQVTGRVFHGVRKIISRQVAFYDTASILYPSADHDMLVRAFSTTNGLMGSYHDGLIERKLNQLQDYDRDLFPIPDDIRQRLSAMVDCYL